MHDARDVANEFIRMGIERGDPFDHQQIQKLAYIAHGFVLALYDRPLSRQPFEVWKYGPICSAIYYSLSRYGNDPVAEPIPMLGERSPFDRQERNVIDQVFEKYGHLSGPQLSGLTYGKGTPWQKADSKHLDFISDKDLGRYYRRKQEEYGRKRERELQRA